MQLSWCPLWLSSFATLLLYCHGSKVCRADCPGNPMQPMSLSSQQAFHPIPCRTSSSWYLAFFYQCASSISEFKEYHLLGKKTGVNTKTSLSVVLVIYSGNFSYFPGSTCKSQSWAKASAPVELFSCFGGFPPCPDKGHTAPYRKLVFIPPDPCTVGIGYCLQDLVVAPCVPPLFHGFGTAGQNVLQGTSFLTKRGYWSFKQKLNCACWMGLAGLHTLTGVLLVPTDLFKVIFLADALL